MFDFTLRLNHAVERASYAYNGKYCKGATDIPYVCHPVSVALIVSKYTSDEDTIIAALFHDILEDIPSDVYSEEKMREEFGDNVTEMVIDLSEKKRPGEPKKPWMERKTEHLDRLRNASYYVSLVSAADKMHNMIRTNDEQRRLGMSIWDKFNASWEQILWYYEEFYEILLTGCFPDKLLDDYRSALDALKND